MDSSFCVLSILRTEGPLKTKKHLPNGSSRPTRGTPNTKEQESRVSQTLKATEVLRIMPV